MKKNFLNIPYKYWYEFRVLITLVIIAFTIKSTLIEIYIVPTGSMENTIMTGDMLVGNKFVYGMKTPPWIGLPYTRIGFDIPWLRFPKYKTIETGDVTIFEFPRDPFQKYVKRCIGTAGDLIWMENGDIFVNQKPFLLPKKAKYIHKTREKPGLRGAGIYSSFKGNKDNLNEFMVPYNGMEINFNEIEDWNSIVTLLVQDGNDVQISDKSFTVIDPQEIGRTKGFLKYMLMGLFMNKNKVRKIQNNDRINFTKNLINKNRENGIHNPWEFLDIMKKHPEDIYNNLKINGVFAKDMGFYTIKHDYYFFIGDNRDNSYDSRFWGFVPDYQVLGTPLVSIINIFKLTDLLKFNFNQFFRFEYIK
ncbi:MAG: signal peptidase I [Candidatus Marinimicrobia bacterium]|nr:signal peptidase I [Candidatus Neomarinimicrobiota bacterium]|tara:strand:- start:4569 stop:5651 length:1083 start_codon:yes stop_codon:yes gene_type:complete